MQLSVYCFSQLSPGMSVLPLWKVIRNKLLVTCYLLLFLGEMEIFATAPLHSLYGRQVRWRPFEFMYFNICYLPVFDDLVSHNMLYVIFTYLTFSAREAILDVSL